MVKRLLASLILIFPLFAMAGDASGINHHQVKFEAIVLEVHENSLLVESIEGSVLKSADILFVSQDKEAIKSKHLAPIVFTDYKEGDVIEITFNGLIAESFPAQIAASQIRKRDVDPWVSFEATILEVGSNHLMVEAKEGTFERKSSDKIVICLSQATLRNYMYARIDLTYFKVGDSVKITYNGLIMTTYPTQIVAHQVKLLEFID